MKMKIPLKIFRNEEISSKEISSAQTKNKHGSIG